MEKPDVNRPVIGGRMEMLCCIMSAFLIAKFIINWKEIKHFLGFEEKDPCDREGYPYED